MLYQWEVGRLPAPDAATFWAQMRQKADLSGAASIQNRTERGTYVLRVARLEDATAQPELRLQQAPPLT